MILTTDIKQFTGFWMFKMEEQKNDHKIKINAQIGAWLGERILELPRNIQGE